MITSKYQSALVGSLALLLSGTSYYCDLGTSVKPATVGDIDLTVPANITRLAPLTQSINTSLRQLTTEYYFTSATDNALRLYYLNSGSADTDYSFGGSTFLSEKFTAPYNMNLIQVNAYIHYHAGSPTQNILMQIQTDSSGVPSGSLVTGGSVLITNFYSGTYTWQTGSFPTSPNLSSGTDYHIVLSCSGTSMPNNAYYLNGQATGTFNSGIGLTSNTTGSIWASGTQDYCVDIYSNQISEVGLFAGSVSGSVLVKDVITPFTKDTNTEIYIYEREDYSVNING
jgi:hypothetical protein